MGSPTPSPMLDERGLTLERHGFMVGMVNKLKFDLLQVYKHMKKMLNTENVECSVTSFNKFDECNFKITKNSNVILRKMFSVLLIASLTRRRYF